MQSRACMFFNIDGHPLLHSRSMCNNRDTIIGIHVSEFACWFPVMIVKRSQGNIVFLMVGDKSRRKKKTVEDSLFAASDTGFQLQGFASTREFVFSRQAHLKKAVLFACLATDIKIKKIPLPFLPFLPANWSKRRVQ